MALFLFAIAFICGLPLQTFGILHYVSSIKHLQSYTYTQSIAANTEVSNINEQKSDDDGGMPASMVLLLIFLFSALGLIAYCHIKKDYLTQRAYKRIGTHINSIPTRSYGSTFSPNLSRENIDEYIDDQLYGNNAIIERLNAYRVSIQQRFTEYMEKTPEPVLFESNPDKSVEAYCKNPEIPSNPNYIARPLQHTQNYDPVPSPALQKIFDRKSKKSDKQRGRKRRNSEEKMEYEEIKDVVKQKQKISLKHRMNCDDFSDDDHLSYDGGNGSYDSIPDGSKDAYSDSDKRISDSDNGNGRMNKKDEPPLISKVVVLDLD